VYLSKLAIKNFRGLRDLEVAFHEGLNVLIGENNTGKTAVLDALRLTLGLGAERRDLYLTQDDFHVDGKGDSSESIEFHLTFDGLTDDEQGIFVEMRAVNEERKPEARLHVRATYDEGHNRIHRTYWGGEHEGQQVPSEVLGLLYAIHLGALRDATRDLSPSRGSRIGELFRKLVPNETDQKTYAAEVSESVRALPRWQELLSRGKARINEHLAQVSLIDGQREVDIDFLENEFRRIVEGLRVHLPILDSSGTARENEGEPKGRRASFEIWQNGLGYNNLIYAATVLGDLFERKKREPCTFVSLLIEEPEAHLHPQLQNLFFRYLQMVKGQGVQLFVTSHSPTVTAKTDLDSLIVLNRWHERSRALPLRYLSLEEKQKKQLQRFLDVTKSQLFFAKGVILVEGISEALLMHVLAAATGDKYDLERKGIEVVNIGGVAFEPFARLFNAAAANNRLDVRCAIVTDDDRTRGDDGKWGDQSDRAKAALRMEGGLVRTFTAWITFEYELYKVNEELLTDTYRTIHPKTVLPANGELDTRAWGFVEQLKRSRDKAEFAQALTLRVSQGSSIVTPEYIQKAFKWVVEGDAA